MLVRTLRRFAFVSVVAAGCILAACTEEVPRRPPGAVEGTTTPIPGGSSTATEAGAGDAGGDAEAACTTLPITGRVVDRVGTNGDPPTRIGGNVVDGIYDLTDYLIYVGVGGVGGPTGVTAQSSIRISGGKIEQAIKYAGSTTLPSENRTLSSFTQAASTLNVSNICPSGGGADQFQYTATETALTITNSLSKEAFTFTKR